MPYRYMYGLIHLIHPLYALQGTNWVPFDSEGGLPTLALNVQVLLHHKVREGTVSFLSVHIWYLLSLPR